MFGRVEATIKTIFMSTYYHMNMNALYEHVYEHDYRYIYEYMLYEHVNECLTELINSNFN